MYLKTKIDFQYQNMDSSEVTEKKKSKCKKHTQFLKCNEDKIKGNRLSNETL
jgi:hypothetical protein